MNKSSVGINDKILKELDDLVKESGVSPKEFLSYIAEFYKINNNMEKDIINYDSYYDSFVG